jgi:hypothetical protein
MAGLDLTEYYAKFDEALNQRYKREFTGFGAIRNRFDEVRKGRPLVVDDVLAIFDDSLPYVEDWTKPDRANLEQRMSLKADGLIRDILKFGYDKKVLSKRRRRAMRITRSLKVIDKLGFARFFVDSDDPTLAAIIAWREFEIKARSLLYNTGERSSYTHDLKMDAGAIAASPQEFTVCPLGRVTRMSSMWNPNAREVGAALFGLHAWLTRTLACRERVVGQVA